jgi:mannose-6-phosphate isomerase
MKRIRKLATPIQPYAWGSRRALAELQGRPAPTAQPEAELWVGAHPLAPSTLETEAGAVPLSEWIARDPEAALGAEVLARSGPELPFLLKILAVEEPLSLQAHPDGAQAAAGFAREEEAGLARDAAGRCYRDPHAKAEMACALGGFETLLGFRAPLEILARFDALGVAALGPALAPLRRETSAEGWREAFAALLRMEGEALASALGEAVEAAAASNDPGLGWLPRLAEAHPGDPGALAPVYLEHRRLAGGEAALVPPGLLHTHLHGVCVEVMTSSDNVLRGGLTAKHVDRAELLQALDFAAPAPRPLPAQEGADAPYPSPSPSFALWHLCPEPDAPRRLPAAVSLVLCTAGSLGLVAEADPGGRLDLGPGEAAWVPACAGATRLEGRGEAWRVAPPPAAPEAGP